LYVSITNVEHDNPLAQGILESSGTSAVAMIHSVQTLRMIASRQPISDEKIMPFYKGRAL